MNMNIDVRLPLSINYEYVPAEGRDRSDVLIHDIRLGFDSIYDSLPPEVFDMLEEKVLALHELEQESENV